MGALAQMIMNAFKFMIFLALVSIVWCSPVKENAYVDPDVVPQVESDDIVPEADFDKLKLKPIPEIEPETPETDLVKLKARKTLHALTRMTESVDGKLKPERKSDTNKNKCKAGMKVRWYTGVAETRPTGSDVTTMNAAIETCSLHCTQNLKGHKKCPGKINAHQLTKGDPYGYDAQCNCSSAFKTAAMSIFAMALVLANIKNLF